MAEERNENLKRDDENAEEKSENRFEKKQPLRHPLALVAQEGDKLKINKQLYRIKINKDNALDLDTLRRKYDPYLDQYDFLVGDVSSEHLRLKGFYKDVVRTAIDRKENTIADYLLEYCNPGTAYFVLELVSPVHRYSHVRENKKKYNQHKHRYSYHKNNFKKRRVHRTKFQKRKTIAIQKGSGRKHAFVIKKRKDNED